MAKSLVPILKPGKNCWKIVHADKVALIVDACDYYHHMRGIFERAQEQILILGWDFDTRIVLEPGDNNSRGRQETLGEFFLNLARKNPDREIDILKWSFGARKQFLRPSSAWMLWRWARTKAIQYRFDGAHPPGCSHHQKIVVVDGAIAACGGIDMTAGRWDTPDHKDNDERRRLPDGSIAMPWHDVTMLMQGPVAGELAALGSKRWERATNSRLRAAATDNPALWPTELPVHFSGIQIGISRTRAAYGDVKEVREIEALYLDMIAAAEKFIYIENQYLTSGRIAAALAERLTGNPSLEVVIVMPRTAEGWLEQVAMDAARIKLARAIASVDPDNRFRIYVPVTQSGVDIYVHAKVACVDDRFIRVGSSNMNNRSLGLDSECDVVIDAALAGNEGTCGQISALMHRLIAEHLDVAVAEFSAMFAQSGSLIQTIEHFRSDGKTLELLDLTKPGALDSFIAENELLDPESPEAMLELPSRRGLWASWRKGRRMMMQRTD